MSKSTKPKLYTDQELAFLEAYKTTAKGDIRLAMDQAGYAPSTKQSEVVRRLKDELHEATIDMISLIGGKAVAGLLDILENPNQLGAANKIKAAQQVLDRLGATKTDAPVQKNQGGIFILPPKEGSIIISTKNEEDNA